MRTRKNTQPEPTPAPEAPKHERAVLLVAGGLIALLSASIGYDMGSSRHDSHGDMHDRMMSMHHDKSMQQMHDMLMQGSMGELYYPMEQLNDQAMREHMRDLMDQMMEREESQMGFRLP